MAEVKNYVILQGLVLNKRLSHKAYEEVFYLMELSVERKSGVADVINVIVSERLPGSEADAGEFVKVIGELRSRNVITPLRNKLELSVFAMEIIRLERDFVYLSDKDSENRIELDGYICKPPVLRETPYGRVITEVFLAVNRPNGRTDYIPCIAWGRTARYVSELPVGSRLKLTGRIQSRNYQKQIAEEMVETRTAYEVSVQTLHLVHGATVQEDDKNGEN